MKKFFGWFKKLFKKEHKHIPKEGENRSYVPEPEHAHFGRVSIKIHGMDNFSEKERNKFLKAVKLGNKVLNSVEFKELVSEGIYRENKGLSGIQIWELICTGKDLYNSEEDRDIDVFVTMYHNFWAGTIGYTYPDTFKTWINRQFFQTFDESQILGNVIHEALHNFGFTHKDMENRYNSVPYKVGYIARDLVKRIMEGQGLTPLKDVAK